MHTFPRPTGTRICIIRHGETDWNVAKRIQGHADVPLNETGRAQALAMACNAAHQRFAAIYRSDLVRAVLADNVLDVIGPVLEGGKGNRGVRVIRHGSTPADVAATLPASSRDALPRYPESLPVCQSVTGRGWGW
jgi:hypothetical protein